MFDIVFTKNGRIFISTLEIFGSLRRIFSASLFGSQRTFDAKTDI